MSDRKLIIIFSPRAKHRLDKIAEYLLKQTSSSVFVVNYLNDLESYVTTVLQQFPEAGTLMEEYGSGIRRLVYKRYSFLYRVSNDNIQVLTVCRENKP